MSTQKTHPKTHYDVAVVGGGIVGLATAWRLSQRLPDAHLLVLEKMPQVADHQTGNNSGVIHSGLYYKPGSRKARLCVQGREQLVAFAQEHGVAHEVCGKVVVAVDEAEEQALPGLFERGKQNGLADIRMIDARELRAYEPFCRGVAAIHVPYTGIVDYRAMSQRLWNLLEDRNHCMLLQRRISGIERTEQGYRLHAGAHRYDCGALVVCGGLQADRLARMEGLRPKLRIVPFRGDYYDLHPRAEHKVRNLIYPVPNPAFPFLGVHFTRMVNGGVECGPNAVFAFAREGYSKSAFQLGDTLSALSYSGVWRLFERHWRHGLGEYQRAWSKARFLAAVRRLIPSLSMGELVPARSGIRAMALGPDGAMLDDFHYAYGERSVHVLNAPSPAATASLAIGQEVTEELLNHLNWS